MQQDIKQDNIINIHNPIPILQQQESNILNNKDNGNPNISNIRKKNEEMILQQIIQEEHEKTIKKKEKTLNQNIADSFIGLLDDLFTKEKNRSWATHLKIILHKNKRFYYLGILLLTIGFVLIIFEKIKIK